MRFLFIFFLYTLGICFIAKGDHVVGYDMTLINMKDQNGLPTDNYKFRIKFYRDRLGIAIPAGFSISIYKNSPNDLVLSNIQCPKRNTQTFLTFPPEDCAPNDAQLKTEVGIYETDLINLGSYSNSSGYYAVADICCRNIGISNVAGNSSSYSLGMVCEFPRLNIGSNTRFNSSPEWKKYPLSIFCIGRPYTLNWNIVDPDNDSLAFSLVQPIDAAGQKPFPLVPYAPGYNVNYNIIDGVPDVSIHPQTGVINFIPTKIGKYLVAFRCSEFRNGIKIGETRREYQLEVVECPVSPPITLDDDLEQDYITDTIDFDQPYSLVLTSRDAPGDSLFMAIIPNPKDNLLDPATYGAKWGNLGNPLGGAAAQNLVINDRGTVIGEFRWEPSCRHVRPQPYSFIVVVKDQTCPSPFYDTTFVNLYVRKKPNLKPFFILPDTITNNSPPNVKKRTYFVNAGDRFQLAADSAIKTYDKDSAQVVKIAMIPDPSNGAINANLLFSMTPNVVHSTAIFSWETRCADRRDQPYLITFKAYDDDCARPDTVEFQISIYVKDAPNLQPQIKRNLPTSLRIKEGQTFQLSITAIDSVSNPQFNRFREVKFLVDSADFLAVSAGEIPTFVNASSLDSTTLFFSWKPNCYNIRPSSYRLRVRALDNGCPVQNDLYEILLFVDPTVNDAPQLSNLFSQALPDTITINRYADEAPYRLDFSAIDTNTRFDSVYLYADVASEVFNASRVQYPATFIEKNGKDSARTYFEWKTECGDIRNDYYEVRLFARDNRCIAPAIDTLILRILVQERPNFLPRFTPATLAQIPPSNFMNVLAGDTLLISLTAFDTALNSVIYIDKVFANVPANLPGPEIQRVQGPGKDSLSNYLRWMIDCSLIREEPYTIRLATWDDACRNPRDSSTMQFQVKVNKNPALSPQLTLLPDTIELVAGERFSLEMEAATSQNAGAISIFATGDVFGGIVGNYARFEQTDFGFPARAKLEWESSCDQIRAALYFAEVSATNLPCQSDTQTVGLYFRVIANTDLNTEIPNAFSPNGDDINDAYSINKAYKVYCDPQFKFTIFNRWGKKVYESVDPDFKWIPDTGMGAGIYFYTLQSRARTQTGTIDLIK